ncbi:MAG: Gfo/Idh/MocA family oxidoreductase, partial [Gemmatimonadaceae bacterium]|nr:Gfo/Idh/MocA family oxidoreductase [Chitinophagaceae bacterium]
MDKIKWGIIGCGDVTEKKSGPAFNKVPDSQLVAVMRRDASKAEDYAKRHQVPKWYSDAQALINDPQVNAVYIATPPSSHKEYAIAALRAGKPVYVEKPMAMNAAEGREMNAEAELTNIRLTVAHYRRELPLFKTIKSLLAENAIGRPIFADLKMMQPAALPLVAKTETNWRTNPAVSGGGLFHDLAPHQLDLMYYFFGKPVKATGVSTNNSKANEADDLVSGQILFNEGIVFNGLWCFSVPEAEALDRVTITGASGKIEFAVFGNYIRLNAGGTETKLEFEQPEHVQQPMIEAVVKYFLGKGENPCTA